MVVLIYKSQVHLVDGWCFSKQLVSDTDLKRYQEIGMSWRQSSLYIGFFSLFKRSHVWSLHVDTCGHALRYLFLFLLVFCLQIIKVGPGPSLEVDFIVAVVNWLYNQ